MALFPSEKLGGGNPYPCIDGQIIQIGKIGTNDVFRLYKEYTINELFALESVRTFSIPELNQISPEQISFDSMSSIRVADNSNRKWLYHSFAQNGGVFNISDVVTTKGSPPWDWSFSIRNTGTSNAYKTIIRAWINYWI